MSVSRAQGTVPLSRMSPSTFPAPTLGSWSASPTRISRVPGSMARSRLRISIRSIIEASSAMMQSASSGFSAFREKAPSSPPYSSSRWMVFASAPVASVIRLAARPVGAHSSTWFSPLSSSRMQLIMVVFPVPGPPVITKTPVSSARTMASRWFRENRIPRSFSKADTAFTAPANLSGRMASISSRIRRAVSCSARQNSGR